MPSTAAKTDKPTKAEKQALKTALKNRFGIKQADLDALLTTADENNAALDLAAIEVKLLGWMKARPKAGK